MTDTSVASSPTKSSAPAAVSTSATGTAIAVIVCWWVHVHNGVDVPPEVAIAAAGVFTGALNVVAVLWSHWLNHRGDV